MTYRISIETDNAAFDPDPGAELARILRGLADRLEDGGDLAEPIRLRDFNGNTVGEAVGELDPEDAAE
jgi:hypothetical protein